VPADTQTGKIEAKDLDEAFHIKDAIKHIRDREDLKMAKSAAAEAELEEKAEEFWACPTCTFLNSALHSECLMCGTGWTGQRQCPPDHWCCMVNLGGCSMFNSNRLYYCDVCNKARPDLKTLTF